MLGKQIIVNYHYVENPSEKRKGIFPMSIADFAGQIDFLSGYYRFASVKDVVRAAHENRPDNLCAITFDDGLKDQFENAAPILKSKGVPAIFFVITSALRGNIPATHKRHVLMSAASPEMMIDLFNEFIEKNIPEALEKYRIPKDRRFDDKKKLYEPVLDANLKLRLMGIPPDLENRFLDFCLPHFNLGTNMLAEEIFMSAENIKKLIRDGFEIGSHTDAHVSLDNISDSEAGKDAAESRVMLKKFFDVDPEILAYPFGRYKESSQNVLETGGFSYAVTTEQRAVTAEDNNFLIPRYDASFSVKKFIK